MNTNSLLRFDKDTGIPFKKDACIAIIKTEWNSDIVDKLEASCIKTLLDYGVANIKKHIVPGAVELPFAAKKIASKSSTNIDAIILFGCVIKGDTPHFDFVCKSVTDGVTLLNVQLEMPLIFGVLTVLDKQQAIDRIANGKEGDKGEEAALTALKMIQFINQVF